MTDANYQHLFKNIGIAAKAYFVLAVAAAEQATCQAALEDQIATGLAADVPSVQQFSGYDKAWSNGLAGFTAAQKALTDWAIQYLGSAVVQAYFVHNVPTAGSGLSTLISLALEMASGGSNDNKTIGSGASGLKDFMDAVSVANGGTTGTWHTASPGDYPDATYVVDAAH